MILVSKAFDCLGFYYWKKDIEITLSTKNALGFVSGDCRKLRSNYVDLPCLEVWNSLLTSWIINALDKAILESVVFTSTACEIWMEFEENFKQSNGQLY